MRTTVLSRFRGTRIYDAPFAGTRNAAGSSCMDPSKKNDFPGHVEKSRHAGHPPCFSRRPVLVYFFPRLADLADRLVTIFWLRNDRVTRRLKTSKPQGLTRHLVHTPTRHCLLFVLRTSAPRLLLVLPCLPFTSYCSYTLSIVFSIARTPTAPLRDNSRPKLRTLSGP